MSLSIKVLVLVIATFSLYLLGQMVAGFLPEQLIHLMVGIETLALVHMVAGFVSSLGGATKEDTMKLKGGDSDGQ